MSGRFHKVYVTKILKSYFREHLHSLFSGGTYTRRCFSFCFPALDMNVEGGQISSRTVIQSTNAKATATKPDIKRYVKFDNDGKKHQEEELILELLRYTQLKV